MLRLHRFVVIVFSVHCLIRLPRQMLQLVVYRSDVGTCLSEPTLKYNEVVDIPYSNHCQAAYGVELLRAVTFCTEIEYVKRNSLVGLGHKVAFCSVSNGDEITLYGIAFPSSVCIASHN